MILGEVLHILREEASAICSSNTALYVLLFTDDSLENTAIYEEIAKKRFGKRGLPNELRAQYCEEASFNNFCDQIETRYLKKIHDTNGIYRKLKALILDCPYLPQQHKKQLLGSCNPDIRFQLARFIAACILCGSYHSSMLQSKEAHNRYGLSLNFMNLDHEEKQFPLQQRIWEAEQRAFLFSHKEGSRFFDLNIIERLLPHGYITKNTFLLRARTTDGEIRPLMDIYKDNPRQDIAVTGEGGIGKTTFLQQLLEEEFWDDNKRPSIYKSGRPVPIFIELKQCPSQIQDWYEEHRQKTNFITRYIGQLLENHRFLDNVSATTLESIEMELQRIPEDGNPQYLLLLDGFNEISVTGKGNTYSCRSMLSNEISIIHNDYANVRIIATSRETQAAYFTSSFQNIYLTGLEENDIREHLELQNFSDTSIGITMAMKPLVKCLKVPLFLCMFCYEHPEDGVRLPETPGEILYNFFHGNSTFYNARKRAADTHTNPLNEWDTANDTLRRRYNPALYECRDLIYDRMHQLAILVHQYNGISIFSGNPVHLSNALCYPNPEYYVGSCCYHEATQWLALMFCKSTHEYVEIINLYSGERETIYSTLQPHETLESVQFHPDGKHLLICSGHTCAEYDMVQKQIHTIENAGANELYIDANYTDDKKPQIQIAIVEHYNYEEPSVLPHCDHYSILRTQHRTTYKREWRYYMPELTKDSAAGFLFYSYDIGSGASYTREEYQTYWCTCGFFLHDFPKDDAFDKIRCSRFQGGRELPMEKKFSIRQMIYCKHDFALANQYRTEKNCHNYAYCSDDFSEVIEIFDHKHITYWKHLNTNPTSDTFVYDDGENTSEELGYVFFDTVIPWTSDSLLSCSEQYRMIQLQKENQGKSVEIPYSPGISICGCSLYNVSANQVLLELLQNNGGNL